MIFAKIFYFVVYVLSAVNALTYSRKLFTTNNQVDSLPALPAPKVVANLKTINPADQANLSVLVGDFLGKAVSNGTIHLCMFECCI